MGYLAQALRHGHPISPGSNGPPADPAAGPVVYKIAPSNGPTPPLGDLTADGAPRFDFSQPPVEVELDQRAVDDRLVALIDPGGVISEEYRSIRTGLLARWQHQRHLVHTITSATPQEGKTLTSLNLGVSFGELHGRRTLVIEADLRLPQFQKLLGLPDSPGLIGVLKREADIAQCIQRIAGRPVDVLVAGGRAHDQAIQLLSNPTMASLIKRFRQHYDHVVIDTPPVVNLADAGILGSDERRRLAYRTDDPHPREHSLTRRSGP